MTHWIDSLSFVPRGHHRFGVRLPVDFLHPRFVGKGQVLNVSLRGWRVVGGGTVEVGDRLALRLSLTDPTGPSTDVRTIVRWTRGQAVGLELDGPQPILDRHLRTWARAAAKAFLIHAPTGS